MMLGFLLARAGVEVTVLEKHAVHPSTLELLGELGLLDDFLKLPHQEIRRLKLAVKLREGRATEDDLRQVQERREPAVRKIQAGQVFVHRRMLGPGGRPLALSWPARKLLALPAPLLRRVGARVVGIGFRPEHVETRDVLGEA
jgi:hypothetical protein